MEQPGSSKKVQRAKAVSTEEFSVEAGLRMARRVVRGMRRAARTRGLTRAAAAAVARRLGGTTEDVYGLWCHLRSRAVSKMRAHLSRGAVGGAWPSALDWAIADLLQLYVPAEFDESIYEDPARLKLLYKTFELVERFRLEDPGPPSHWVEAARYYSNSGEVVSGVALQRRWHELKADVRRRARAQRPPPHIHRAVLRRFPHVGTEELPPWRRLVAAGQVAKPTSEYGPAPGAGGGGGGGGDARARLASDESSDLSETESASSYDDCVIVDSSIVNEPTKNAVDRTNQAKLKKASQKKANKRKDKKCVKSRAKPAKNKVRKKKNECGLSNVTKGSVRKKSKLTVPETTDHSTFNDHRNGYREFNCDNVDISKNHVNPKNEDITINNKGTNRRRKGVPAIDDISEKNYKHTDINSTNPLEYEDDGIDCNDITEDGSPKSDIVGSLLRITGDVEFNIFYDSDEDDKKSVCFDSLSIEGNPLFSDGVDKRSSVSHNLVERDNATMEYGVDPKLLISPRVVLTRLEEQPRKVRKVMSPHKLTSLLKPLSPEQHTNPRVAPIKIEDQLNRALLQSMSPDRSLSLHKSMPPHGPPWVVLTRLEDQPWLFQKFLPHKPPTRHKVLPPLEGPPSSQTSSLPHVSLACYESIHNSLLPHTTSLSHGSRSVHRPPSTPYEPMTQHGLPSERPLGPHIPSSPHFPSASHRPPSSLCPQWPPATYHHLPPQWPPTSPGLPTSHRPPSPHGSPTMDIYPSLYGLPTGDRYPLPHGSPSMDIYPSPYGPPSLNKYPSPHGSPTMDIYPSPHGPPTVDRYPSPQGPPTMDIYPSPHGPLIVDRYPSHGPPTMDRAADRYLSLHGSTASHGQPSPHGPPTSHRSPSPHPLISHRSMSPHGPSTVDRYPSPQGPPTMDRYPSPNASPASHGQPFLHGPPASHGQPFAHGPPTSHGQPSPHVPPASYGQPSPHGPPASHGQPSPHVAPASYGQPSPHGLPASHGQPSPHGPPASHGQPSPHVPPASYGQPSPHGLPASHSQPSPHGPPASHGQPSPHGPPASHGQPSPHGPPASHGQPSPHRPPASHISPSPHGLPISHRSMSPHGSSTSHEYPHAPQIHSQPSHFVPTQYPPFSFQHDDAPYLSDEHRQPLYNGVSGTRKEPGVAVVRRNKRCEVIAHIAPKRRPRDLPSLVAQIMTDDRPRDRDLSGPRVVRGVIDSLAQLITPTPSRARKDINSDRTKRRRLSTASLTTSDRGSRASTSSQPSPSPPALGSTSTSLPPHSPLTVPSPVYLEDDESQFQIKIIDNPDRLKRAKDLQGDLMKESDQRMHNKVDQNLNKSQGSLVDNTTKSDKLSNRLLELYSSRKALVPTAEAIPAQRPGGDLPKRSQHDKIADSTLKINSQNKENALQNRLSAVSRMNPPPGQPLEKVLPDVTCKSTSVSSGELLHSQQADASLLVSLLRAGPMLDLTQESDLENNSVPANALTATETDSLQTASPLRTGPMVDLTEECEGHNPIPTSGQTNTSTINSARTTASPSVSQLQTGPINLTEGSNVVDKTTVPVSSTPSRTKQNSNGPQPAKVQTPDVSTLQSSVVDLTEDNEKRENDDWAGEDYLDWSSLPVPSEQWVVGREPTSLCVLALPAHCWVVGGCLVLSSGELPAADAAVWAPRPRVRLQLVCAGVGGAPDWLAVAAGEGAGEGRGEGEGAAPARAYCGGAVYQKLSERPLVYAKLLGHVGTPAACRALLVRGAPLLLYCLRSGELYPLQSERVADGSCRLRGGRGRGGGGGRGAVRALDALRHAMMELTTPPPTLDETQTAYLKQRHEQIASSSAFLCDAEDLFVMSPRQFAGTYRLPRERAVALVRQLTPLLPATDELSREEKILLCLRYLASSGDPRALSAALGVAHSVLLRSVAQVLAALAHRTVRGRYLRAPRNSGERAFVRHRFLSRFELPGVLGAIVGVHVPVHVPEHEHVPGHVPDAECYLNEEGTHSLNVQLVFDADGYILSVDPQCGGATGDARAWARHRLRTRMLQLRGTGEDGWLIGGPSYPQEDNLMIPIQSPSTPMEKCYNEMHARAYSVTARGLAALRTRWPRLRLVRHVPAAVKVITAGAVLHNLANIPDDMPLDINCFTVQKDVQDESGQSTRDSLVKRLNGNNTITQLGL